MYLSFTVAGEFLRTFMQLLQTACRRGDGLFFEPYELVLDLRAVNSSRSTHFLASITTASLVEYRRAGSAAAGDLHTVRGGGETEAVSGQSEGSKFHLVVSTKALLGTVLRQTHGLRVLNVSHNSVTDDSSSIEAANVFQWECVMTSGVVKRFVLPLLDAQPERAHVAQERYSFDACASAKTWGAFLRCLPSTASHIIVQPFDTQLEFLAANHTEGAANSKVIAQRGDLLFVHRKQLQALGGCSLAPATVGPPLPGKVIEAKPFKQMCLLADQLSLMIRVRSGAEDVPLFIMAVTREEAQRAATCNAPAFAKGAMASGALPNRGVVSGEKPYPVQFAMYMAATDVKPRTCRKDVGSSSRSTTYSPQLAARDSGSASDVVSLRASDLGGGSLESHQSVEVIRQGETVTACDLVDHQSRDGSCISAGTLATSTSTGTTVCPAHQTLVNQTASSFSAYAPTPSPSSNVDGLVVPATPQEKSMATSGVAGVKRERVVGPEPFDGLMNGEGMVAVTGATMCNDSVGGISRPPHGNALPYVSRWPSIDARYSLDFCEFMQELDRESPDRNSRDQYDEALDSFIMSCGSMRVVPASIGSDVGG